MHILVDADACPQVIKEIIFKAATKHKIQTTLIANQYIATPAPAWINARQVSKGFDVADNEIVKLVQPLDLIITQDIPLAFDVIQKQGLVLTPRGEELTKNNIQQRLSLRHFLQEVRDSGIQTGGPKKMNHTHSTQFANAFDRILTQRRREPRVGFR